ncbi:MAG: SGNH/GDSL hydrolase family protein [Planctomycetia bacterium]|nr:SGNH/GDSL hydrolase family protein [Planctomycetia bacterium]
MRAIYALGMVLSAVLAFADDAVRMEVVGDWQVNVTCGEKSQTFAIARPTPVVVENEVYASLPVYRPDGPSWRKGITLRGVSAQECSVENAYVPGSIEIWQYHTNAQQAREGIRAVEGKDFQIYVATGNVGRLEGGILAADRPVEISYQYYTMRLDSIVRNADGSWGLVPGVPHVANPELAKLEAGQTRLGTVWVVGNIDRLDDTLLFPISEPTAYEPLFRAEEVLPRTWAKLQNGEEVRVLAWGDSVTACGYIPDAFRWQQQFVDRLQAQFPKAHVVLISEGWGGRNSDAYRAEPPGSPKNYREKVLAVKPDLIVSEFVNDAGMNEARVALRYGEMLKDFEAAGMEWIICTPHYVRPSWMGLTSLKGIDTDPRPYVKGLRAFAAANRVALADAAFLYGQQYKLGIPYITLMKNNINHPNAYGMGLFADALMAIFQPAVERK